MSFINYAQREINCKLVYYGPGLCGKTTNLQYIYNKTNPDAKGKMISLATETERTLFFDFLPVDLGAIRGFKPSCSSGSRSTGDRSLVGRTIRPRPTCRASLGCSLGSW